MSVIIGQNKILSIIDSFSADTFPRTVLLNGPFGSGKHLLSTYITKKLNLDSFDITDKLTIDTLEEISLINIPMIYLINLSQASVKEQNTILKFIEEPPTNAYIILFSERLNAILETVKNRCVILQLEKYNPEDLKQLAEKVDIKNPSVIALSKTPGEIFFFNEFSYQLEHIERYCEKIIEMISGASYSNVLIISDRIAYKGEENKFNPKCFFRILKNVSYQYVLKNTDKKYQAAYCLTEKFCEDVEVPHVNVQYLFENYLFSLKQTLQGK